MQIRTIYTLKYYAIRLFAINKLVAFNRTFWNYSVRVDFLRLWISIEMSEIVIELLWKMELNQCTTIVNKFKNRKTMEFEVNLLLQINENGSMCWYNLPIRYSLVDIVSQFGINCERRIFILVNWIQIKHNAENLQAFEWFYKIFCSFNFVFALNVSLNVVHKENNTEKLVDKLFSYDGIIISITECV